MEVREGYMEVQEETACRDISKRRRTIKRLFLPATPYILLPPSYNYIFPKIPLCNITDYVIQKSFFKFIIRFWIT